MLRALLSLALIVGSASAYNDVCEAGQDPAIGSSTEGWGTLESPNYSSNYSLNDDCIFEIAPECCPDSITLTFDEVFGIEPKKDGVCKYDFISVLDEDHVEVAKICDTDVPSPITVQGQKVKIVWCSDHSIVDCGWAITWDAACPEPTTTEPPPPPNRVCQEDDCKTSPWGELTSTNYGTSTNGGCYYDNEWCDFTIDLSGVTDVNCINIEFDPDFVVEPDGSDCYDWLKIRDGDGNDLTGELCGTDAPGPFCFNTDKLVIEWDSDYSQQRTGWKLTWEGADCSSSNTDDCGDGKQKDNLSNLIYEHCSSESSAIDIPDGNTRWFSTLAYACGGCYSRDEVSAWYWTNTDCPGDVQYTIFISTPSNGYDVGDPNNWQTDYEPETSNNNEKCDSTCVYLNGGSTVFYGPGDRIVISKGDGDYGYDTVGYGCWRYPGKLLAGSSNDTGKRWKYIYTQQNVCEINKLELEPNQQGEDLCYTGLRFGVKADCC